MGDIVVCPKVIRTASINKRYLVDLLFPIASSYNNYQICVDDRGIIERRYIEISNNDPDVFSWLRLLNLRRNENVRTISVSKDKAEDDSIVVDLAVFSDNRIIVADKSSDFEEFSEVIISEQLSVLTKEEAIADLVLNLRKTAGYRKLTSSKVVNSEDASIIVDSICRRFAHHIENNSAWRLLYELNKNGDRVRIDEKKLQIIFYISSFEICKNNDLKISPEVNSGNGPVDFNFSHGMKANINVEMKFADHQKLVSSYRKQVEAYNSAEQTERSIYLVVYTNDSELSKIQELEVEKEKMIAEGLIPPALFIIDGRHKVSASKR